jgi:hypothetical protein
MTSGSVEAQQGCVLTIAIMNVTPSARQSSLESFMADPLRSMKKQCRTRDAASGKELNRKPTSRQNSSTAAARSGENAKEGSQGLRFAAVATILRTLKGLTLRH